MRTGVSIQIDSDFSECRDKANKEDGDKIYSE